MSVTTLSTEKQGAEMLAPATIFDDVFRTLAQKMPELLIPLVNEVFHTNYPENQEFEQLRNEHYEKYGKVITDSILRINQHLYHILCHEHFLASKGEDQERVCKILEEYALIVQKLDEYTTMREQSGLYLELINMIKKIANHIIQEDNPVKEGIGDVMGGKVLKLLFEELLEKGEITKMTTIVCRRLRMGDSPEVIADLLQEPPQEIERICNIAKDYAPDYDVEKIVEKLLVSSIE